jgi:4-hydroxy-tetrahydrodipicolinate synthase
MYVRHFDKPQGVIPAVLMPFSADFTLNEAAYRRHLSDVASIEGIAAITINGHAAEVQALTIDEQQRAAAIAKEVLGEKVPIIVGIYTNSSLKAARIARKAQEEGANGLLVFPPEFMSLGGQLRPEIISEHLKHITGSTDLPLILFQYPRSSNLAYPLPTIVEICERFSSIKAIKDQGGDDHLHAHQMRELRALDRPVASLTSHNAWLLRSLRLGCDGVLSAAGSVVGTQQVALLEAVRAGDLRTAQAISDLIGPTVHALSEYPILDMHNRMKEALVILGRLKETHVRPPLVKPSPAKIEEIRMALASAGLTAAALYPQGA